MEKINYKVLAIAGIFIVIIVGVALPQLSNIDNSNDAVSPILTPVQKETISQKNIQ